MSEAAETLSISKVSLLGHKQALAAAIGLGALIWFLLLSGWLGVKPGSVMTKRNNVLFNSDTNIWIERMAGEASLPWVAPHPLQTTLWRGPCRALDHPLGIFLPAEYAEALTTWGHARPLGRQLLPRRPTLQGWSSKP
jgi:hypothetical protein